MASPVGHTLAGLAAIRLYTPDGPATRWQALLLALVFANGPDVDWLPGFLSGQPARYHQSFTHSLGFALVVSFLAAWLLRRRGWRLRTAFLLPFLAYSSHLVLDILAPDGRPPFGIPLLWPLSDQPWLSPVSLFPSIRHVAVSTATVRDWIAGVLVTDNVRAILLEIAILLPLVLFAEWRRARAAVAGRDVAPMEPGL